MRNNAKQPTLGHVIMMATASLGWLILFGVTLVGLRTEDSGGASGWLPVVFSAVMALASGAFAIFLAVRLRRVKAELAARRRADRA